MTDEKKSVDLPPGNQKSRISIITDPDKARLSLDQFHLEQNNSSSTAATVTNGRKSKDGRFLYDYDEEDYIFEDEDELLAYEEGRKSLDPCSPSLLRGAAAAAGAANSTNKVARALKHWRRQTTWSTVKKGLIAVGTFIAVASCATWIVVAVRLAHTVESAPFYPSPLDVEPGVRAVNLSSIATRFDPFAEIESRFNSIGLEPATLSCTDNLNNLYNATDMTTAGKRYMFALNLYNNQAVLPTLARTLLAVSDFLGRDTVHISVFENGSTDNTTLAMAHFAAVLTAAGIPHTVTSDYHKTEWKKVDRIAQLAVYRNIALQPVHTHEPFDTVVFVNDVFACPRDVLELVSQRQLQQADAVCGMDWRRTSDSLNILGFGSVKFYDNWVARSIDGELLRARFDILGEFRDGIQELFSAKTSAPSRDRFRAGRPLAVYSCWNGMIALDAKPFVQHRVAFRSAFGSEKECAASECKLLARDFWQAGFRRWLMVPSVHVTYDEAVYDDEQLVTLREKAKEPAPEGMDELVDWSTVEEPSSVVCIPWLRGWAHEVPFRSHREGPFR